MNILNVCQQNVLFYVINILCFMFKCRENLLPNVLQNLYCMKPKNKYNLRINNNLIAPFCHKSKDQFFVSYRGPYLWNKIVLPNFDFSTQLTFASFKQKLKKIVFLIENIY